ncbi:MAG: hypothetical protein KH921_09375 [Erysipelotrichaceae bacterium]|nr:hypothetical protein [Erysipelotrichaceae bacterium]
MGKFVKKRNVIDVSASIEGDITQDVHKVSNSNKKYLSKEVKTINKPMTGELKIL